jgi:hypothetical protein
MDDDFIHAAESRDDYDQHLSEQITLLAGQINAANYRLLKLIAEFDDRQAWSGGGTVRSCAHWLNWQCGIALGAQRRLPTVKKFAWPTAWPSYR